MSILAKIFKKKDKISNIKKEPLVQTPIKENRILIISDIHFPLNEKEQEILKEKFDSCLLLGDIPQDVLQVIQNSMKCNIFGIFGNHDTHESFNNFSFKNINGLTKQLNNYTVSGMEGSSKYKDKTPYVMMSQEDSCILSDIVDRADILISHDSPYQIHSTAMNKEGYKGITKYIQEKQPLLHIYGHHHIFKTYNIDNTLCICNYRFGIIEKDGMYHIV